MKRRRGPDPHGHTGRIPLEDRDDPGRDAARARVEALLQRLMRIDLQVIVVAPPDDVRFAARERARDAAIVAGRAALLDEATAAAREVTIDIFARGGFSGTWALTKAAISVATTGDRVAAAAAFEEAAAAAVVEDLIDDETLEVLRSTSDEFDRLQGLPSPGSLSAFAAPAASTIRGPLQVTIIAAFVIFSVAVGLATGSASGLVVLAIGLAIAAAMVRRRQPRDP